MALGPELQQVGSLGLGLLHAAPARPGPAESARARGCSLAHGPPTLGGSVLQALSLVFYLGFSSQLGLVSPLSLVQLPFPVWFQVESKTRVTAFPESVRSGQLAWRELGTHLLGLPVLQTCSHGHCVSTGTAGDRGTSGADLQPQQ